MNYCGTVHLSCYDINTIYYISVYFYSFITIPYTIEDR